MPVSGTFDREPGERWVRGTRGDVTVVDGVKLERPVTLFTGRLREG